MSLKAKVSETMKAAMKSGDKETLQFARNLHALIRKKEIDDRVDLDDGAVQKIAGTAIKQRRESIAQFKKGGRDDLVANEEAELKFLEQFIPPQLSDEELRTLVEAAVSESGASSAKEMGKVMKVLMPKVQGRADGKKINEMVRSKLG